MNSTFHGEGGILSFKVLIKPLKLLKTSILVSTIKLAIYIFVIITLASLALNYTLFSLLIFVIFFIGVFAFSQVNEQINQIKSLTKEFKTYGQ